MNRPILVAAVAALWLGLGPATAASPAVEAATKSLSDLANDSAKLQGYCRIIKEMDAASDDEAKFDELEQQMRDLLRSFGPQYEQAMELAESTESDSEDGKALEAAFDQLDQKCG